MTDRKKPGVAFWATLGLVVVLVGYPLSFGPACWLTSRMKYPHPIFEAVYLPLGRMSPGKLPPGKLFGAI